MSKRKEFKMFCPKCGSDTRQAINAFAVICNKCELRIPMLVMEHILMGKGFEQPMKVM